MDTSTSQVEVIARPRRRGSTLDIDWSLGLWGRPQERPAGLACLPVFEDRLLDRLADIFRIPGLPHFMSVQIERQVVFVGLEDVVAGRDRAFDGLALCDRLADCEIDLGVAQELLEGRTEAAQHLRELAVAASPVTRS